MKIRKKLLLSLSLFVASYILLSLFFLSLPVQWYLAFSLCYFLAFSVFLYVAAKRFLYKLFNITFMIQEMAAGNFGRNLKGGDKDEVGQLVNALIELKNRLQTGVAMDVSKHHGLQRAKMDFVTIASHQLRTPLSIIKWYVDYVLSGDAGELNLEQKRYLSEIYMNNERLIELVNALLDASRIDVGTFSIEPKPGNIVEAAEEALEKFIPDILKKEIIVDKKFDEIPEINLDAKLIRIVFANIISNAVKYTPQGGKIRFVIKKTDTNIFIQISDTGCGIPREYQPKIFTKMFRADNAKKIETTGTGLGLYISKAVIEKSGGKIWFESPSLELFLEKETMSGKKPDLKNVGTSFFITIPLKGMKRREGTKKLGEG